MKTNYPWVFWIRFEKIKYFQWFQKIRYANCLQIQVFKLRVLIGMPWVKHVLKKADVNYPLEGISHFKNTNKTFNKWYHFHIGKYND